MKYREIEFKYAADNISLTAFVEFAKTRPGLQSYVEASGFDHFYEKTDSSGSFGRHRIGPDMNQLTFKRKTTDKNNFIRTEHNLNLTTSVSQDQVKSLFEEFGYKYNTSIFKTCFVYKYEWYTLVYYVCYNSDMKERGRFVEIEMSEDYAWASEEEAMGQLTIIEKLCKSLGVTPQSRIRKSLFELYKNEK
jgi:adenylate cyclase class IV